MNGDTVGQIEYSARINTKQLASDGKVADNIVSGVAESGEKSFIKLGAVIGAVSGVVQSVLTRAMDSVSNSISGAIKRVDTLNNSSRVFASLGFDAKDTASAMSALDKSIRGLPTSLDSAVRGVQLFAGSTNDIGKSQKLFSALNNAVLGFGGNAEMVEGSVIQLSQAFSNGRIDAQTWNSLIQNGLGPALGALARQMGVTTGQFKTNLSDGTISVEQFQDAIIKMNKEGGGGMASFEKLAKDATSGIGTGIANAETAVSRGIASIIQAIGSENISGAISAIGKGFEIALKSLANFVTFAVDNITKVTTFVKDNQGTIKTLATVITIFLIPAIVKFGIQSTIAFGKYLAGLAVAVAQTIVASVRMGTAMLFALGPIGLIVAAVAAVSFLIVKYFDNLKESGVNAVNSIKNVFSSLIGFFSNLFRTIGGFFGRIGETIGDSLAGAFKTTVNAILGFFERQVNNIVSVLNQAIHTIDNVTPGKLPRISSFSIPRLADGGIVEARPGGILANIGEAGQDEAVIPLDKLDDMVGGNGGNVEIVVNMQGIMARSRADLREIGKDIVSAIDEEITAKGGKPILRMA